MMAIDIQNDPRLDPRVKAYLGFLPAMTPRDVDSREEVVAQANTPDALEMAAATRAILDMCNSEEAAPSTGLRVSEHSFVSSPDDNTIKVLVTRPDNDDALATVIYLHGGGMMTMSAFDGMYRGWAKLIAANGVCVVAIDFRNALTPSSAPEVEPFPAGLNDCVSGIRWTLDNAASLGVDPARVVIAGESGGGNLTLASALAMSRDGDISRIAGLYALCPYIAGTWPQDRFPSSSEMNGVLLNLHSNQGAMAYGIKELENQNPLAWPIFATTDDVKDFPKTVISVNECDPLRDEGLHFYRLLLAAGVPARGRMVMGTMHGTEIFNVMCPDISRDTARDLAAFAKA